ncbi:Auxin response factor 6 [Striga hermonthica]|uniref:Auxin-responsive protein n=1 Tax=Striga hermonthica TaxID=68872 RepID=A0A9N7RIL7_STRHE|nr:Auxin response factor 6 [Striga hermonthica]
MNSPFMFFRGNARDLGTQSLNYQGVGPTSPWMQLQPRFEPSILGMQSDTTAFQEMRWADSSKQSQLLFGNRPVGLTQAQAQIPQQQQQPQNLMHNTLFQQQMLHQNSFDNNDSTQMQHGLDHERASSGGPVFSQAQTNMHISSPLHGLFGPGRQEDGAWPAKRVALDPLPFTDSNSNSVQVEQLGLLSSSVAHNSVSLPPFPGSNDPHNHFVFGLSGLKGVGESETVNMGVASSSSVADYSFNPTVNTNNCVEDSGFVPSSDNGELANPTNRAFVKVYKSGTFGRSLDITKFSSYNELRMELARMFGLQAQLEDSLRSGWQLVFVDCENDVLLLGDDPWPEFVNSVYCIKILSPEEVQEMRKRGLELLNNVPLHQNVVCEGYPSHQEPSRNMNANIASVGTLNF